MSKRKRWPRAFTLYLLAALVIVLSGWGYLLPSRLKPMPALAADLAAFSVAPVSAGVDDLIGQTNASWQFTFQTQTALQPGEWVQIIFPDTSTMNMPPFDFSSLSVSAATSSGEASLHFNTASSTMMGQNIVAVPVSAPQASTSLPFTITLSGVGNPIADINMIPNSFTWTGQTTASNGSTVIDGPQTAAASLVRRGDRLSQWDFSLSNYSASASGVEFSFSFTASTSLAVGEKIAVNFPSNFIVSAATTSDQTIVAGGSAQVASTSLAVNTNYGLNSVVLTIGGGGIDPTATATVSFKIGNITNPVKGSYNGFSIYTLSSGGGLVDGNYYGVEEGPQMAGPPPVDSIQIGGTNTISGTVKVRRANGNLETVTANEAAQIKVGMGCPEKMFFVGTKLINSDGTFTYNHLLDARYMLFVMPANETNSDFFANYLAPAMIEVNVSGGQSVSLTPTFVVPDGVVIGTVTGAPAGATDGFIRAYNGLSETYAPIFNSPAYTQPGFSATGTGYIKVPVKSGYDWKINIMTNNILATSSYEYWPPVYKPINIPAGAATTTLPTKSFVLADQTLNVRVKDTNGTIIDDNSDLHPCVNVRRAGGEMMDRGEPVCQTTDVGGENVYQVKVPNGAYVVEVMMPGAGFMEKPVTISGTTTLDVIVAAPDTYISGTIVDADGFPIQGAAVFAQGATGGFANDLTDSSGAFKLFVAPGTYSLDAFVPGFGPLERKTSVVVTNTANATGQDWTLNNNDFATISGRVYVDTNGNSAYDAGEGLEGVKMYAHNPTTDKGSFAVTLSDGQYSLRVPKASGYTVGGFSDEAGELPPLNNVNATSDVAGQDFVLAGLGTLTVTISGGNNSGLTDFFLHAYNPSANRGNGTNSWAASGSDLVASLNLPAGSYEVRIGSPALGDLMDLAANAAASSTTITANNTTNLTVSLPTLVTVSGTVVNGANATVWISRLDGPGQYSTMADSTTANFSLKVPAGYSYQLGANLPGYTNTPVTLNNLTTATSATLTLTAAAGTISGTLSGAGTALSEGFVWAEKQGGEGWVGTEVNADGSYILYIGAGTWQVYADAPCYYQSDGQTVSGSQTLNIDLTAISGCSVEEPTVQSITPTAGGAIKKKLGSNEVAVNIPANALGTESSNVTVTLSQPGVLPPNSANSFPIDNAAVAITAANSSGSSISTLNSAADITLTYSDDDLPSGASEDNLQLAYWDTTTQTWQTVAASIDTENNTITASVDHFTDFAPILPTSQGVPDTPTNLAVQKYSSSGADTKLSLSWTRVDGADGYYLYRDISASGTFPLLATISSGATVSYTDSGLSGGTTYYYKITAKNSNGESAASAAVSAATCASVANGTVSGASCSITCASGYSLSGSSCVQASPGGGGTPLYFLSPEQNNSEANLGNQSTSTESSEEQKTEKGLAGKIAQAVGQLTEKVNQTISAWQKKIIILAQEATEIWQANVSRLTQSFGLVRNLYKEKLAAQKYVQRLIANYPNITAKQQYALINFVTYGTPNTFSLGEGERAGVLNSYQSAYGKLPASQTEWDDVLKIACGRWPAETSQKAESRAKSIFEQIYHRSPDRTNPHDDAAIVIIAYGLRPAERNLASERAAIVTFHSVFGRWPTSATDWDTVRAIAYSGAAR